MISYAGSAAGRLLADRVGLNGQLSAALVRRSFTPVHDRGRVLVVVLLTDGGEVISDIDVLRHQSHELGPVASAPTVADLGRADPGPALADRSGSGCRPMAGVGPPACRVARLLDSKRGHRVKYSVGFAVTNAVRDAIALVPKDA